MLFAIKKKTRTLSTAVFDDIFNSLISEYVTGLKLLSRRFYLKHTMLKVNFYLKQAPGMHKVPQMAIFPCRVLRSLWGKMGQKIKKIKRIKPKKIARSAPMIVFIQCLHEITLSEFYSRLN